MLTDDERKTINHAADVLGPSLRDLATRLRAIAAPRTAPSPTPDACAAIERAATWIELGELGGTPDAVALVATLREFVRTPRVATVGELLATARDKFDAVEFMSRSGEGEWTQINGASGKQYVRVWTGREWIDIHGEEAQLTGGDFAQPARIVPARLANADPATRGNLATAYRPEVP